MSVINQNPSRNNNNASEFNGTPNINSILYPNDNNANSWTKLGTPDKITNDCINWATKYLATTPYLYELTEIIDNRLTRTRTANTNTNISMLRNTSVKSRSGDSKSMTKKMRIRSDNIKQGCSGNMYVKFNIYTDLVADRGYIKLNRFEKTTLFIIRYSIYLLNHYKFKKIAKKVQYNNILDYINNDIGFREELKRVKYCANAYKLDRTYMNIFYKQFINKAIEAYKNADIFLELGGNTYISSIHGTPIITDEKYNILFTVPKNTKIALLTPLSTIGVSSRTYISYNDYMSRDVAFENIIKLGPEYYQNINNNVPHQYINMNIYHEGQMIPNIILDFTFNICIYNEIDSVTLDKIKSANSIKRDMNRRIPYEFAKYKKYNTDSMLCSSLIHYVYNKLISHYIDQEIQQYKAMDGKYKHRNIHRYRYLNVDGTTKQNIYFKCDSIHFENIMIIQDVSFLSVENIERINKIFTKDGVTFGTLYDNNIFFNKLSSMVDKAVNILANFDILYLADPTKKRQINNTNNTKLDTIYSLYTVQLSIDMEKYISIIDNELQNYNKKNKGVESGGNVYLFNACRYYNNIDNVDNNISQSKSVVNINYQIALTYITNIINKYVSSLINRRPIDIGKYVVPVTHGTHTISDLTCNKIDAHNLHINRQSNTLYLLMALDISKDYMILLAISNIILNSQHSNMDFDIIKISLYNLFIKPKYKFTDISEYTISQISKIIKNFNDKDVVTSIINIINSNSTTKNKNTPKNNTNSITGHDLLKIMYKVVFYIIQYYPAYINWIINNGVIVYLRNDKHLLYSNVKCFALVKFILDSHIRQRQRQRQRHTKLSN